MRDNPRRRTPRGDHAPRRTFRLLIAVTLAAAGCAPTMDRSGRYSFRYDRAALARSIALEEPGDYYVGRRYFKRDYKFWGYVRRPLEPWNTAKLVMLNEHRTLAPDREEWRIGSDNGYEYKLFGYFSGDTVYEPASNGFYPEFVLQNIELISETPLPMFRNRASLEPSLRRIDRPE